MSGILDGRGGCHALTGGPGADDFATHEGGDVDVTDFDLSEGGQIVYATHGGVIGFLFGGGRLLAIRRRNVNAVIEKISLSDVSVHSQQTLKPAF